MSADIQDEIQHLAPSRLRGNGHPMSVEDGKYNIQNQTLQREIAIAFRKWEIRRGFVPAPTYRETIRIDADIAMQQRNRTETT